MSRKGHIKVPVLLSMVQSSTVSQVFFVGVQGLALAKALKPSSSETQPWNT